MFTEVLPSNRQLEQQGICTGCACAAHCYTLLMLQTCYSKPVSQWMQQVSMFTDRTKALQVRHERLLPVGNNLPCLQLSTQLNDLPVFSTTSAAAARLEALPPPTCGAFKLPSTAALFPPSLSRPTACVQMLCVLCATLQT